MVIILHLSMACNKAKRRRIAAIGMRIQKHPSFTTNNCMICFAVKANHQEVE